jgi:hypothetical protein
MEEMKRLIAKREDALQMSVHVRQHSMPEASAQSRTRSSSVTSSTPSFRAVIDLTADTERKLGNILSLQESLADAVQDVRATDVEVSGIQSIHLYHTHTIDSWPYAWTSIPRS